MTEVVDTSDFSSLIEPSQSDLSIAISSPRLESNATTSTACMTDDQKCQELLRDLTCVICNQLFERPVMVLCGHSYCESCIERRTRDSQACLICGNDVGTIDSMIPSITLDTMIQKVKCQDGEVGYDDLYMCDEKAHPKVERKISTRKQLFFSIGGPTVCSSPLNQVRRFPLPPHAKPQKSALKLPPDNLNSSLNDEKSKTLTSHLEADEGVLAGNIFKRNGYGRRSERYTSSTQPRKKVIDISEEDKKEDETTTDGKIKRNSFLRRSLNAFRSKTRRSIATEEILEEDESGESEVLIHTADDKQEKEKSGKSLWRRLFMPRRHSKIMDGSARNHNLIISKSDKHITETTIAFIRLETNTVIPTIDLSKHHFGYYTGIGKKFEKFASGEEITLVIFGNSNSGKTTFTREIGQLFAKKTGKVQLITAADRYRMSGIDAMPYPEGDNRLPHIVSLLVEIDDDCKKVLDVIDPEYDNANLPQSYMDVCDAAYYILDARHSANMLSARQLQRNLKNAERGFNTEFEVIVNIRTSDHEHTRNSYSEISENMKKKTIVHEMSVNQLNKDEIESLLIDLCKRVTVTRNLKRPSGVLV